MNPVAAQEFVTNIFAATFGGMQQDKRKQHHGEIVEGYAADVPVPNSKVVVNMLFEYMENNHTLTFGDKIVHIPRLVPICTDAGFSYTVVVNYKDLPAATNVTTIPYFGPLKSLCAGKWTEINGRQIKLNPACLLPEPLLLNDVISFSWPIAYQPIVRIKQGVWDWWTANVTLVRIGRSAGHVSFDKFPRLQSWFVPDLIWV